MYFIDRKKKHNQHSTNNRMILKEGQHSYIPFVSKRRKENKCALFHPGNPQTILFLGHYRF